MKLAQLHLDAENDIALGSALEDGMPILAPLIDRLESLESECQMETTAEGMREISRVRGVRS